MTDTLDLPPTIQNCLRRFVMRRRRLDLLRAAGLATAGAIAWILVWCVADRLIGLPAGIRLTMLLIAVAVVVGVVLTPLRRLGRPIDWTAAAAALEAHHGSLGERLSTVTSQLLGPPSQRGSKQILTRLTAQLESELAAEPHRARIGPWPALRTWLAAAGMAAVLLAVWPNPWLDLPRLLHRSLCPWSDLSAVTTVRLNISPGDIRLTQGGALTVNVTAQNIGDQSVWLNTSPDGIDWTRVEMTPLDNDQFRFQLAPVDRGLRYFISGGDAASPTYSVQVILPPPAPAARLEATSDRKDDPLGYDQQFQAYFQALGQPVPSP